MGHVPRTRHGTCLGGRGGPRCRRRAEEASHHEHVGQRPLAEKGEPVVACSQRPRVSDASPPKAARRGATAVAARGRPQRQVEEELQQQQLEVRPDEGEDLRRRAGNGSSHAECVSDTALRRGSLRGPTAPEGGGEAQQASFSPPGVSPPDQQSAYPPGSGRRSATASAWPRRRPEGRATTSAAGSVTWREV